jgi:hypothetical protein
MIFVTSVKPMGLPGCKNEQEHAPFAHRHAQILPLHLLLEFTYKYFCSKN